MNYKQLICKHLFVIVFSLLWPCLGVSFASDTQEPSVAIQQADNEAFFRGEKANFYIKLLSPSLFAGAPRFELPTLSIGLLYQVQARPVLGTETVDGWSYTSQLYEIWFFPQQSGEITIPAINVTFSISENGTKGEKQYSTKTAPFSFNVKPIPGVPDSEFIIVTDDFDSSQDWKPEVRQGIVGDAVIRTISMRAKNMAAIFLPDIDIPKISGVAIYRDPPEVNDRNERGEATAERKDVITYVFEAEGEYTIPDITMRWWDSTSSKVRENVLKGLTATIAVNTNKVEEGTGNTQGADKKSISLKLLALIVGGCLLVGFITFKKYGQIKDYFRTLPTTRSNSEKAYFLRFKKACISGEPVDAYNTLYLWFQKKYGHNDLISIVSCEGVDPEFQLEFENLNKQLFEKNSSDTKQNWTGDRLYRSVKNIRKTGVECSNMKKGGINCCRLNF